MLGGGQPALIPAMDEVWRGRMEELVADPEALKGVLSIYDGPYGSTPFREAVAGLLRREYGWAVGPENIAVTSGGQTAFFFLFNILGGEMGNGSFRRILLPLIPEYIGYADQGMSPGLFRAHRPEISLVGEDQFKYRIDFDSLHDIPKGDLGAVCASRPTNPSGNVLTDNEVARLAEFARDRGVPLILDNAYGAPFPAILFREITPVWDPGMILTMSLSKIGLPGTRTAIVVAAPEIAEAMASMTAISGLANNNLGQAIVRPMLEDGSLLRLSRDVVKPYYEDRSLRAQAVVREVFGDRFPWRMHVSEGALFLWLWFEGLPVSSRELYRQLKDEGTLVIPGEYFFFGDAGPDPENWRHSHECIRLSYGMDEATVRAGIESIAGVVERLFAGS